MISFREYLKENKSTIVGGENVNDTVANAAAIVATADVTGAKQDATVVDMSGGENGVDTSMITVAGKDVVVGSSGESGEVAKLPAITEEEMKKAKSTTMSMKESLSSETLKEHLLSSGIDATMFNNIVESIDVLQEALA